MKPPDCEIELIVISGDDGKLVTTLDQYNRNTRVLFDLWDIGETAYASEGRFKGNVEMSVIFYPASQSQLIPDVLKIAKRYSQECILVVYKNKEAWFYYTKRNKKPKKVGFFNWYGEDATRGDYTKVWKNYYVIRKKRWHNWLQPFEKNAPLKHPR